MADLKSPGGGGKTPSKPRSFLAGQGWKWLSFLLLLVLLDLLIIFKWRRGTSPESPEWLDRMNRGLAYLEQFNYEPATHQYEQALAIKPKDVATRINLAIALLNQAKPETLDKAVELLRGVLADQPENPYANYCLAIILQYRNDVEGALPHFEATAKASPDDAHAWYQVGKCLMELDLRPDEAFDALTKAVELEPALNAARYALAMHPKTPGDARKSMLDEQRALADAIWEREYKVRYFDMGPHAEAVPLPPVAPPQGVQALTASEVPVALAAGTEWRVPGDKDVYAAEIARHGRCSVVLDRQANGVEDLFLPGAVVRKGKPGDLLLTPDGLGWKDITEEAGLAEGSSRIAAAGDLDNDGKPELLVAGATGLKVFKNLGNGKFSALSLTAGRGEEPGKFSGIALADIDQDGDLDIFATRMEGEPKAALAVWLNTSDAVEAAAGKPTEPLKLRFETKALPGVEPTASLAGLTLADVDGDGDLDMVLLPLQAGKPVWVRNDRLLRFKTLPVGTPALPEAEWRACVSHLDDLYEPAHLLLLRAEGNAMRAQWSPHGWKTNDLQLPAGRQALRLDLNLDGDPDMITLDKEGNARFMAGACREGTQLYLGGNLDGLVASMGATNEGTHLLALKKTGGLTHIGLALPGRHMLVVRPTGLRKTGDYLRTTAESVGTRVGALAGSFRGWDEVGTGQSLGLSSRPIRLGTGPLEFAQAIRLRWPDGVPQAEMDPQVDTLIPMVETNRKPTSCPVLFVQGADGKWEYVTDCLGPGALGEQGPDGSVRPARPVEVLRLPEAVGRRKGKLVLRLAEPMDEVMYLDGARLAVVDHPVGTEIWADERFNFTGDAPTSQLMVVGNLVGLNEAKDNTGTDALDLLARADGASVTNFPRLSWMGLAARHKLDLRFPQPGGKGPLVLCGEGGVDYPYPESMNAATQAGLTLLPPTLARRGADGKYTPVGEIGFPAGLPKPMLARIPAGAEGGEPWRLESNLRVYWDSLRLGRLLGDAETGQVAGVTVRWLEPGAANLDRVGFAREIPSGELVAYDGNARDPVSASRWKGSFTRLGDVRELLVGVDDRLAVCGPGDAVDLEYLLPTEEPGPGMTRTVLLRVHGWCKDTAPTTLTGARVEPLPWRGMAEYPCVPSPDEKNWAPRWNTRKFR
ncbi:MAG: FG-GAP-like repeat-containing protein [Gemmataceae bacterium]